MEGYRKCIIKIDVTYFFKLFNVTTRNLNIIYVAHIIFALESKGGKKKENKNGDPRGEKQGCYVQSFWPYNQTPEGHSDRQGPV